MPVMKAMKAMKAAPMKALKAIVKALKKAMGSTRKAFITDGRCEDEVDLEVRMVVRLRLPPRTTINAAVATALNTAQANIGRQCGYLPTQTSFEEERVWDTRIGEAFDRYTLTMDLSDR
jgi:hypothetical protein